MNYKNFEEEWGKIRTKGKAVYLIKSSIIFIVSFFIIYTISRIGLKVKINNSFVFIYSSLGLFLGNIFAAKYRWQKSEEKYNKIQNS